MNHIKLTHNALDVGEIAELTAHESCGAVSLFVGTTRNDFEGKEVFSLEYEAYDPMAVKEMEVICEQLRERWPDIKHIAIYHRLGLVPVKQASVVIAVSSPHRKASLDAVNLAIEELKRRVPIWKKEKYAQDESAWKENKESAKKKKIDFSACAVVDVSSVSDAMVQITVSEEEVERRIHCFLAKKRHDIDECNIADYIRPRMHSEASPEESTCARTDTVIVKQDDGKAHLKVRRVDNRYGPQTQTSYVKTLDKLMAADNAPLVKIKQEHIEDVLPSESTMPDALQQRLIDIEDHLEMPMEAGQRQQIHQRLKAIEDRLLFLESLSPEYKYFYTDEPQTPADFATPELEGDTNNKSYTAEDIDAIIANLEESNEGDHQSHAPEAPDNLSWW